MKYIGLVRADGKVEYNAHFLLGLAAEQLENGKLYTLDELLERSDSDIDFIKTTSLSKKAATSRWRCTR